MQVSAPAAASGSDESDDGEGGSDASICTETDSGGEEGDQQAQQLQVVLMGRPHKADVGGSGRMPSEGKLRVRWPALTRHGPYVHEQQPGTGPGAAQNRPTKGGTEVMFYHLRLEGVAVLRCSWFGH